MANHYGTRAPEIARNLVNAWTVHKQALDRWALPYLDNLLDALLSEQPTHPEALMQELQHVVPGMAFGTARRLVDLKFGRPAASETLVAASKL